MRACVCVYTEHIHALVYMYRKFCFGGKNNDEGIFSFFCRMGCSKTSEIIPISPANHTNRAKRCTIAGRCVFMFGQIG
jgi:hypothetical protein